jgi:hypothetical protein
MIENKNGNVMAILLIVGGLFVLVMVGIIAAFGSATINWVMDETVPVLSELGMVGDVNMTHTIDVAVQPVNILIQNFTWASGVIYIFGLIGIFGLAFAFKSTGDKWLIGLFVSLVIILMIGCIIMSNIYEDVFRGTDPLALILQEHLILSYLILYSPAIMAIVSFIAGIVLFSGPSEGLV